MIMFHGFFFSLLHLSYLLHFSISHFSLTSQLLIYSTFGSPLFFLFIYLFLSHVSHISIL